MAEPRVAAVEAALVRFYGLREGREDTRREALRFLAMLDAALGASGHGERREAACSHLYVRYIDNSDPLNQGSKCVICGHVEKADDQMPDVRRQGADPAPR